MKGDALAALALTEREAGSDIAGVQTRAEPAPGGGHTLTGAQRYITSGGIAHVLIVTARTPAEEAGDTEVSAFLVTPGMPGFTIAEPRMETLGLRGTAVASLEFKDMPVPAAALLGEAGKGLKVALTALDSGRIALGASCTGAARTCQRLAVAHADTRRQFGRTLGEFELVKARLSRIAAATYAMEAMTTVTAALIDRGAREYTIETAMLKVFTTEALWDIVNDAFHIHGGAAAHTGMPLERILRDARLHLTGDGANDVLLSFIALIGTRWPGAQLREIWEAIHHPWQHLRTAWQGGVDRAGSVLFAPHPPVQAPELQPHAARLGRTIWRFNLAVDRTLIQCSEDLLERQYMQERLARAAMDIYASACVLSRWDADLAAATPGGIPDPSPAMFLRTSYRRIRRALAELRDNDDAAVSATAEWALRGGK